MPQAKVSRSVPLRIFADNVPVRIIIQLNFVIIRRGAGDAIDLAELIPVEDGGEPAGVGGAEDVAQGIVGADGRGIRRRCG
jgi:hypothetical protein